MSMNRPNDEQLTAILDRFDSAWENGGAPTIDSFLPVLPVSDNDESRSSRRAVLTELVMIDLERRWRSNGGTDETLDPGQPALRAKPTLEDYVERYPDIGTLDELPLELICEEYRVRCCWGDRPTHADYLDRFPEQSERLRDALAETDGGLSIDVTIDAEALPCDSADDTQPPATIDTSQGSTPSISAAGMPRDESFGDYEILEEIARGGMGVVYKARQKKANRIVALKMILTGQLAGDEEVKRFYAEAEAAANLDHPGIVPIYDVGELNGLHFFSMGFVEGESLKERVSDGPLPQRDAAETVKTIAEAIAYAHGKGVIHRDLKPANVLLEAGHRPRITDFGLAKQLETDSDLTATGQVLGTPSYMPPEQAAGRTNEIGPAADIYALGAILYELLTGRPPFQAASALDILMLVREKEPATPRQLNTALDQDLDTICLKCLEKSASRRYQSATALVDELSRYLSGEPILARPIGKFERIWRWCQRKPTLAGLCALLVTLFFVLGIGGPLLAIQQARIAEEQRNNATQQSALREKADQQAQRADREAASARTEARRAERMAYGSDMLLVQRDWVDNKIKHLKELLDRYRDRDDLKGFVCGYWDRMVQNDLLTLKGHTDSIHDVAFSPDGMWLASASSDNKVLVWDTSSGQEVLTLSGHAGVVNSVRFSPNGSRLASASDDKTVRVWEASTGQETLLLTHEDHVNSVAFSPDSASLATATGSNVRHPGKSGEVRVWDTQTGEVLLTLKHERHSVRRVNSVAFSPDGRRLAAVSRDDSLLKVWDVTTGRDVLTLTEYQFDNVAFSPDGLRLAGSGDPLVVLDAVTGKKVLSVKGITGQVRDVAFSPDGQQLASAGESLKVWDANTGDQLLTLKGHSSFVSSVDFSPDGQRIASAGWFDGTVKVWDATSDQSSFMLKGSNNVAFSADGNRLASGTRFWDLTTLEEVSRLEDLRILAFGPRGERLAVAAPNNSLRVWDAVSNKKVVRFDGHTKPVRSVAFSPDGQRLVSASSDRGQPTNQSGEVKVWDTTSGQEVFTLKGPTKAQSICVAFSPDSHRIALGSGDGTVRLWDAATGEELITLSHDISYVTSVAFSPNGQRLASSGSGDTVKVWDTTTGQESLTLRGHSSSVSGVAFSPDGERLASVSGKTVRVWDALTGRELLELNGPDDMLGGNVMFSGDGLRLAAGSINKTIAWWDARPWTPEIRSERVQTFRRVSAGRTTPNRVRVDEAIAQSATNLAMIAFAMHNYHDHHRKLPPSASYDSEGKPLLSWRVHLLPYLGQEKLFEQFRLDEPWDSEHNRLLISQIPIVYRNSSATSFPHNASYLVPTGKGAIFEGRNGLSFNQIPDGLGKTILVVEVNENASVIWTKPDDLNYDHKNPLDGLGSAHPGGFHVVFADSAVRFVGHKEKAEFFLRALMKADGGLADGGESLDD